MAVIYVPDLYNMNKICITDTLNSKRIYLANYFLIADAYIFVCFACK